MSPWLQEPLALNTMHLGSATTILDPQGQGKSDEKKFKEPRECWEVHISQDSPRPSLVLRHSVRVPQCGTTKNYTPSANQCGAGVYLFQGF